MQEKDKRIETVNEVLSGIKVLKLYSWENSFEEKVMVSGKQEHVLGGLRVQYIRRTCTVL